MCFFLVPLGSIPALPAESCAEIKASEGENAVSGNYWFDSIKLGQVIHAPCNMSTKGKYILVFCHVNRVIVAF